MDNPKVCTQDLDSIDIPREYTKLFKHHFYSINLNMIPACTKAYKALDVKHEPLTLIPPHFEAPLPLTQPSVSIAFSNFVIYIIFYLSDLNVFNLGISSEFPRIATTCFRAI